jgi:hypothetical protein
VLRMPSKWSWNRVKLKHVGKSEFWGALDDWMASRGFRWPHSKHPSLLVLGDCVCDPTDCVYRCLIAYRKRHVHHPTGEPRGILVPGKTFKNERYRTTPEQVHALLRHVKLTGNILDCCGGKHDAISEVIYPRLGVSISTNDMQSQ